MDQLSFQHDKLVAQARGLEQAVEDACRSVPELVVPAELSATEQIHRLAAGVREARKETTKVQLELNLQIVELQLKVQPSTPPKVKEQHALAIQMGLEKIGQATQDCIKMLDP